MARRRHNVSHPFTVTVRGPVVEVASVGARVASDETQAWSRARHLSHLLQSVIAAGPETILVDLNASAEADTSVLAVLIDARSHARRRGAELVVRGSPALRQLAEICRLQNVLCMG